MKILEIVSKETKINKVTGVKVPVERIQFFSGAEVLCQDTENIYVRNDGDHRKIPMVSKYRKDLYNFFTKDHEVIFDEYEWTE